MAGNLSTRAPDVVAAVSDDTLLPDVSVRDLATNTRLLWEEQRARLA